ncbi:MAG: ABC transporter ATP-binding protein, partial [Thermoanaerobaculia bacterium]
ERRCAVYELKRLWSYFWRYRFLFAVALLCSVVVSLTTVAFTSLVIPLYETVLTPAVDSQPTPAGADVVPGPLPSKEHILSLVKRYIPLDEILQLGEERAFLEVPIFWIVLFLFKGVFTYFSSYLMDYIGLRAIMDLRGALYSKIIQQAVGFFSRFKTGELISRVTNDVNRLQLALAKQLADLIQFSLILVGMVGLMLYYDWKLSVICGLILPVVLYPIVRFGQRIKKVAFRSQVQMGELTDRLHETISGARVVTGFNMQDFEMSRFSAALSRLFSVDRKGIRVLALTTPVMELLGALISAVLIWYSGSRIQNGTLDPGVLLAFLTSLTWAFLIIKRITRINNKLQEAFGSARRIFDLMDVEVTVKDAPDARKLERFEREIRYADVSFAYDERVILSEINLAVEHGQVVAVVGSSGAGKTTLINLIPRFFDVTGGSLQVDGQDVRELTTASLRDQIAIVTQEIILFNDTVHNNIAYGRLDAPRSDVEQAARAAYAHEFIEELPLGYDTVIGERGHFLSVGQRQRLAIARALLSDSPILILDEATSALDSESELLVQNALGNLMEGRTVFVIAHRLSTIRQADLILVLEDGRIAERGSHEELLAAKGIYTRLHDLQFREPDAETLNQTLYKQESPA